MPSPSPTVTRVCLAFTALTGVRDLLSLAALRVGSALQDLQWVGWSTSVVLCSFNVAEKRKSPLLPCLYLANALSVWSGQQCPPGHACPYGSTKPAICLSGTYQSQPAEQSCHPCPPGEWNTATQTRDTHKSVQTLTVRYSKPFCFI